MYIQFIHKNNANKSQDIKHTSLYKRKNSKKRTYNIQTPHYKQIWLRFPFLIMFLYTNLNKTVQNIFLYTCCCVSYWGSAGSRYRFPNHTATSFICAILLCRRRRSFHAKTLVAFKICSHASLSHIFIHYFFLPSTTQ